jgi:hypothetical protein
MTMRSVTTVIFLEIINSTSPKSPKRSNYDSRRGARGVNICKEKKI